MTESEPKQKRKRILLSLVVLLFIFSTGFIVNEYKAKQDNSCVLYINSASDKGCIELEVADTNEERAKGLSGRENMPSNKGMLFKFDSPGKKCIWMKDMNFSIDIIWLNSDKSITHIEKDVSPNTYPKSFCPSNDSQYVIELNSGVSDAAELRVGQKLNL